ncbi:hypothetical protein GW17_00033906 [Ensete ventricosum]|nr:hypothetical protein GW17_00033906 [Ensete ventricosum]
MSTTPRYADRNEQPSTRSKRNPLCRNNKKAWARVRRRKESWPVENPKRFLPVGRIPDESAALRNTVEPSLLVEGKSQKAAAAGPATSAAATTWKRSPENASCLQADANGLHLM